VTDLCLRQPRRFVFATDNDNPFSISSSNNILCGANRIRRFQFQKNQKKTGTE
jgi:hypothetical protein